MVAELATYFNWVFPNNTPGLGMLHNLTELTYTQVYYGGTRLYLRVFMPRLLHKINDSKSLKIPPTWKVKDVVVVEVLILYEIVCMRKCYSHAI